jgi:hypothetical protein
VVTHSALVVMGVAVAVTAIRNPAATASVLAAMSAAVTAVAALVAVSTTPSGERAVRRVFGLDKDNLIGDAEGMFA